MGSLSSGVAPQAKGVTGSVAGQSAPLVSQLQRSGVPTVGGLTGNVADSPLPGFGTVSGLTGSLPVTSMLASNSAVSDSLTNVSTL